MALLGLSESVQFVQPPPDDYFCSLCNLVLKKPMITDCCGFRYCEGCIEDPYADTTECFSCPECESLDVAVTFDGRMWKKILELKVRCPFVNQGCQWIGKLGSRKDHIDPQSGSCDHADKICKNNCGAKLSNKLELLKHRNVCPKRLAKCTDCGEDGQYDFITGKHKHECPIFGLESSLERYPFDLVQKLPSDCVCPICKKLMRKPVLTECCLVHYCASCIEDQYNWKTVSYNCPLCARQNISVKLENNIWKKILRLHVRCPHSFDGCPWVGDLGMREVHLCTDCGYVEVECTNGCGEMILRKKLESHLEHSCFRDQTMIDVEYAHELRTRSCTPVDELELYSIRVVHKDKEQPPAEWRHSLSDFLNPPPREFLCARCGNVLARPMLTGCCSKHFCTTCLENPYTFNDDVYTKFVCPECGPTATLAICDKQKWEKIGRLQVRCPLSDQGCYWTGELGQRTAHIDKEKGDCGCVELECKYLCGESLRRFLLSEHEEHFCPKRPSTCQYCDFQAEHQIIHGEHQKVCPELPIQCLNSCGADQMKQKYLEAHLTECPAQLVECTYSYAGCKDPIRRKDFLKHIKECVQKHISLNSAFFQTELEKKEELLHEFVREKNWQLEEVRQIHRQQVEELQAESGEQLAVTHYAMDQMENCIEDRYRHLKRNADKIVYSKCELNRKHLDETTFLYSSKDHMIEVWKGTYNNWPVVVKKLQPGVKSESFLLEACTLIKLEHENIVKLQGVLTVAEPVCIVLHQSEHQTVQEYLLANADSVVLDQKISICQQVACGLNYLQLNLCLHRNISTETVFCMQNFWCKIGDFEFAVFLNHFADTYTVQKEERLLRECCAPEVETKSLYCLKTDVWLYGQFLWQVIMSCDSFATEIDQDGFRMATNPALKVADNELPKPSTCPQTFYEVMKKCLSSEPSCRPSSDKISDLLGDANITENRFSSEVHYAVTRLPDAESIAESDYDYYRVFEC